MSQARWDYNGIDCAATWRVWDALAHDLTPPQQAVYRAQIALEAPSMAVSMRGIAVDARAKTAVKRELASDIEAAQVTLDTLVGRPLNVMSPKQIKEWFYGELGVKAYKSRKSGDDTADREALEKIRDQSHKFGDLAADSARAVLAVRDLRKALGFIDTTLFHGRCRSTFRPAGTESFRFSAQKSPRGDGLNLQTIPKKLRRLFVPDPGWRMGQCDQKAAESRVVAHLSGDAGYIQAHESGDTHTYVCRLIWPELPWTGDDKADRAIAEEPNYVRTYSRRDLAKRVQHGSNYGATEHALCRTLHIPLEQARNILDSYRRTFPAIFGWQERIRAELAATGSVVYPWGYVRRVADNPRDMATVRSVIASIPQAIVAWTNHLAFARVWLAEGPDLQLLAHTHDGLLFQYRSDAALERVRTCLDITWPDGLRIPYDMKLGGAHWLAVS